MNTSVPHSNLTGRLSLRDTLGDLTSEDPAPLYIQLQNNLRRAIHTGARLAAGPVGRAFGALTALADIGGSDVSLPDYPDIVGSTERR